MYLLTSLFFVASVFVLPASVPVYIAALRRNVCHIEGLSVESLIARVLSIVCGLGLLFDAAIVAMWLTSLGERFHLDRVDYGMYTGVPSVFLVYATLYAMSVMAVLCALWVGRRALTRLRANR